jgi:hypothetical protein
MQRLLNRTNELISLFKKDARCLPWLREREKLALAKLSVLSNPTEPEPMWYDA